MILFIFEGEKREPKLFETIKYLFFSNTDTIVYSFGNNIYELYRQMLKLDPAGDIVSILKQKYMNSSDNPFLNGQKVSDFSEVYLFFDYDFQNKNIPIEDMNNQLEIMLSFFNNETDNGKLYINYPMIESIRYTQELPDPNYYQYTVTRAQCTNFKNIADNFSFYKSLDFITLNKSRNINNDKIQKTKQNWQYLKEQNVSKANFICNGNNSYPLKKENIDQKKIFKSQLIKYLKTEGFKVAILNAFPIFLYEYLKEVQ